LNQRSQIDTELAVNIFGLSLKEVVVERTSLDYAFAGFHGNVHLKILVQDLRVKIPRFDIWLHGDYTLLHGEAALEAAAVSFSMIKATVMATRV
jgi:hypothetical protein